MKYLVLLLLAGCAEAGTWYTAADEVIPTENDERQSIIYNDVKIKPPMHPTYICVLDGRMEQAVNRAVEWWNNLVLGPCLVFELAADGGACDVTVDFGEIPPDDLGHAYMHFVHGVMTTTEIIIANYVWWDSSQLQAVVAHELGHALGLADEAVCDNKSLMCHVIPKEYGLLSTDAQWLMEHFSCSVY